MHLNICLPVLMYLPSSHSSLLVIRQDIINCFFSNFPFSLNNIVHIDAAKSSVSRCDGWLLGEKKNQCSITSRLNLNSTLGNCFVVWKEMVLIPAVCDLTRKEKQNDLMTVLFKTLNLRQWKLEIVQSLDGAFGTEVSFCNARFS